MGMCFLLFLLSTAQLEYGAIITPIPHKDILGKRLEIPKKDSINIIYFFDINNQFHVHRIQDIHFLNENIELREKREIDVFYVSRGKKKEFVDISNKYSDKLILINDSAETLIKQYSYSCKLCQQILVIDSSLALIYVSSQLDFYILREVIERSCK